MINQPPTSILGPEAPCEPSGPRVVLHTQAQERGLWARAPDGEPPSEPSAETLCGLGLRPRMWFTRRLFRVSRGLNGASQLCRKETGGVYPLTPNRKEELKQL